MLRDRRILEGDWIQGESRSFEMSISSIISSSGASSLISYRPLNDDVYAEATMPNDSLLATVVSTGSSTSLSMPADGLARDFSVLSTAFHRCAMEPSNRTWCDPYEELIKAPGSILLAYATRTLRRRTKSCARKLIISIPLENDRWREFHPLWEPSIRLPSEQRSSRKRVRQPRLTCASWFRCV